MPRSYLLAGPTPVTTSGHNKGDITNHAMVVVVVEGDKTVKATRFVKQKGGDKVFDQITYDRAYDMAGWKGYVTNIPGASMSVFKEVSSHHHLWRVEQAFRISKTVLRTCPTFHHQREAIEAHLTSVFTALAEARNLQTHTGVTLKALVKILRPMREVTIAVGGQELVVDALLTPTPDKSWTHSSRGTLNNPR